MQICFKEIRISKSRKLCYVYDGENNGLKLHFIVNLKIKANLFNYLNYFLTRL